MPAVVDGGGLELSFFRRRMVSRQGETPPVDDTGEGNDMAKLKEYHFSCGNSTRNTVGFCATVKAHSKAEAVTILQSCMPGEYETSMEENDEAGRLVYFTFYLNGEAVKARHIDEIFDLQRCDRCKTLANEIVGCLDGAEVCRDCFNAGAH